jgi:hypothetical protein
MLTPLMMTEVMLYRLEKALMSDVTVIRAGFKTLEGARAFYGRLQGPDEFEIHEVREGEFLAGEVLAYLVVKKDT